MNWGSFKNRCFQAVILLYLLIVIIEPFALLILILFALIIPFLYANRNTGTYTRETGEKVSNVLFIVVVFMELIIIGLLIAGKFEEPINENNVEVETKKEPLKGIEIEMVTKEEVTKKQDKQSSENEKKSKEKEETKEKSVEEKIKEGKEQMRLAREKEMNLPSYPSEKKNVAKLKDKILELNNKYKTYDYNYFTSNYGSHIKSVEEEYMKLQNEIKLYEFELDISYEVVDGIQSSIYQQLEGLKSLKKGDSMSSQFLFENSKIASNGVVEMFSVRFE